ncbi:MAG TPA: CAP domain-containing protein [Rhizomicrobium sp.]|jgi:hypothetical protein|nr:CAP domain-containing protein [Rhizomicrobium sp.]
MRIMVFSLLALTIAVRSAAAAGFQADILSAHNAERAAVGVPLLRWDPLLADHAAIWAAHLAELGTLQHSAPAERPGEGENLWMGTAGRYSTAEMIAGWSGEKADFVAGTFPDVARDGHWQAVGHYTQMIWKTTAAVGCAMAPGVRWDVLVCRYGPPGNMIGETPF